MSLDNKNVELEKIKEFLAKAQNKPIEKLILRLVLFMPILLPILLVIVVLMVKVSILVILLLAVISNLVVAGYFVTRRHLHQKKILRCDWI